MPSKKLAFINGRPQLVDANARVRSEADRQYNRVRNEQQSDYLRFYHSNEWKQLREQILIRDNSLCQRCGLQASLVDILFQAKMTGKTARMRIIFRLYARTVTIGRRDVRQPSVRRDNIEP